MRWRDLHVRYEAVNATLLNEFLKAPAKWNWNRMPPAVRAN